MLAGVDACVLSPMKTLLPRMSDDKLRNLPSPQDALPGARDVPSQHGSLRVYIKGGPSDGHNFLFVHGISTPCITLCNRFISTLMTVVPNDLTRSCRSRPGPAWLSSDVVW